MQEKMRNPGPHTYKAQVSYPKVIALTTCHCTVSHFVSLNKITQYCALIAIDWTMSSSFPSLIEQWLRAGSSTTP